MMIRYLAQAAGKHKKPSGIGGLLPTKNKLTEDRMKTALDNISPEEALEVLKRLCASDARLRARILSEAKKLLSGVDTNEIAQAVYDQLNAIDVHDLWDRSGSKHDGYSSPEEMATEMFEEVIQPHQDKMKRHLETGMTRQARQYCMGVLKGIYNFEHKSKSEFKDWATDLPAECFGDLLDNWRRACPRGDIEEMNRFITEQCPEYAQWAIKTRGKSGRNVDQAAGDD